MRSGLDAKLCGVSLPYMRHITVHVTVHRVLQERQSPSPRLQHVSQSSRRRVRLWRYICNEGNWVRRIRAYRALCRKYIHSSFSTSNWRVLSCRFCDRHGPNAAVNKLDAPSDLMCVAEAMMPRIILRLIQHLRENWYV